MGLKVWLQEKKIEPASVVLIPTSEGENPEMETQAALLPHRFSGCGYVPGSGPTHSPTLAASTKQQPWMGLSFPSAILEYPMLLIDHTENITEYHMSFSFLQKERCTWNSMLK